MQRTTTDPDELVESLPDRFRADVARLDAELSRVFAGHSRVAWEGVFWGGSEQRIIGYGDMVDVRPRRDPVEWFVVGLAAQQDSVSVYVNAVEDGQYLAERHAHELGGAKVGKSVISFRSLDDVDLDVLLDLAARAAAQVDPAPPPTGRVEVTDVGRDLVLERTFHAPADDVWSSLTDPERLAGWFGVLDGDLRPGATVQVRLIAEEGEPLEEINVLACDPPRSFSIDQGGWRLDVTVTRQRVRTTGVELRHHLGRDDDPGDIGPGWEFYLDRFVASRGGPPAKPFEVYLETLREHYAGQAPGAVTAPREA
ncbi:SRPBCC domain-containing protein [Oerskovia flava]|uniref:SRPBCC domain-containing protein n=1 Tax=Oerskovia flava TaxID=2986422 RepID=UPI0022402FC2|nr:SRPBCC domain-containing protein [Oerskovia sp. JB1-3-2]